MDIFDYFMQKEREFADAGAIPDGPLEKVFRADESSDQRGMVFAKLGLTEDAYLAVYERVIVRGKFITREAYSYALIIDGDHVLGWERDPTHKDSPVHEHDGTARKRKRGTKPIALKRALEISWAEVSLRAEAPLDG